jgi:hypothetical protein
VFRAYFVAHDVHGWCWSIAELSFIGCIGYVNAEINAQIQPKGKCTHHVVLHSTTTVVADL